ncbi:MAG TPA: ABC transporter permease [Acidimicrobiales bacterium]|jgi:hypothetical protein|nr:ABC transporter permease [Acidimicrobiales bacterium]
MSSQAVIEGPEAAPDSGPPPPPVRAARLSDVVRSEWTKLRTVRSTYFTLGVAVVLIVGLGALISFEIGSHYQNSGRLDRATFDPTNSSLASVTFGQLAIGVLGVLVITSEYASGMIRTTLQAMPRRGWLLAAKAGVFGVTALVVGEVSSFAAFFIGQPLLKSGPAPYATIGQPGVARAVFASGLYIALAGLLALGIAVLIRHTAGAITVVVALYFVLPGVANALPTSWQQPIEEYLPSGTGRAMAAVVHQPHFLTPWPAVGVLCIYVVVVMAAAAWSLQRRDA